jgi:hypothetical protein
MRFQFLFAVVFILVSVRCSLNSESTQGSIIQTEDTINLQSTPALAAQPPHLRGCITKVETLPSGESSIFVEGDSGPNISYRHGSVRITSRTHIFKRQDQDFIRATISDLTLDKEVEVLFIGEVLERDPPSGDAGEIVIVDS